MNNKKRITICGYGNVGKSLVHVLSKNFEVSILTFTKTKKNKNLLTIVGENKYRNELMNIYTSPEICLKKTDIFIITLPNFLRENTILKILPFLKKETKILFIPGIGPSQFIASKYLKDYKVFSLLRVPYITRAEDDIVYILGDRDIIKYASLKKEDSIDDLIELMFLRPVEKIDYYEITLTTSNAILHTTRMYGLFQGKEDKVFKEKILFYSSWDNKSSTIFKKCDDEVMLICKNLKEQNIINKGIISLMEYYESDTPGKLTKKLNSIESLKNIRLKMKELDKNSYVLDETDRFLTEDIPFGLLMFKGIAEILNIDTPNINMVIEWAQKILKKDYIKNGRIIDYRNTGCPQKFGIFTLEDLKRIFKN